MNKIDLHIHSTYSSDGEWSILQIAEACVKNQVNTFSITDHNCTWGNQKAIEVANELKLNFIPGIEIDYMSYKNVIELIKDNGGIPILAHPGLNLNGKEELVEKLLDGGLRGVEVFNNYHDPRQIHYFAHLVKQRGMLMTGGSDFHGKTKPLIEIGRYNTVEQHLEYLHNSV